MSNPILIDSSFYITLLSRRMDPLAVLAEAEDLFDYAVTPVIWVEVVRGRALTRVRDRFEAAFGRMRYIRLGGATARRASILGWTLERTGSRIPVTDLMIAAAAIQGRMPLLTFDARFDRIPGLVTLVSLPV